MSDIKYGLQMFSVRKKLEENLVEVLRDISIMGYQGVEFFGEAPASAEDLKSLLEEFKLECCGWHFWGDPFQLKDDEFLKETVEFYKKIGNEHLIISSLPEEYRDSREGWQQAADLLNELNDRLKEYNMKVGYHNHDFEFVEIEGKTPWDILLSATDDSVILQLDTGNARSGGADILEVMEKNAERAETIHFKPYSEEDGFETMIGEDDTPWEQILSMCEEAGKTDWYIIEYESEMYPPLEAVKTCLQELNKINN